MPDKDKLSVTLETPGADEAISNVQTFRKELVATDQVVNNFSGKTTFGNIAVDFDKAAANAERMSAEFAKVAGLRLDAGNVGNLTREIVAAGERSRSLSSEILRIRAEMAKTADPRLLTTLKRDLATTTAEAALLETRLSRLQNGGNAPGGSGGGGGGHNPANMFSNLANGGQLRGAGPLFRAAGLYQYGIDESILNVANTARIAAGISVATLATVGATVAAGVALVKISEHIRDEAKKRLGYEEAIAIAANKEIIDGQKFLSVLKEQRAQAQFSRDISKEDVDQLERRRALSEQLLKLNPTGSNRDEIATQIRELDSKIAQSQDKKTADADKAFNDRNEAFKKNQADEIAYRKKRIEDVNEARKKVGEFGTQIDDLFKSLFAAQGEQNPFVKVFTEADEAIEKTRIATALLSKDLQKQAADMVAAQNANTLFAARIDAALNAVNLRADAAKFRGGGADSTRVDDAYVAKLARQHLTNNFEKLAGGGTFNQGLYLQEQRNDQIAQIKRNGGSADDINAFLKSDDRRQFEDEATRNLGFAGQSESSIVRFLARSRVDLANGPGNASVSDRLDKQLAALNSIRPENEDQRSEVNRRIIALTQGVNPSDLTDAQRNAAASARENEAVRSENAEKDAKAEREAAAKVQTSIDTNIQQLLDIAKKDGLTGVIRIINEAEDRAAVSVGKRPTPRDVTALTDQ